ncbi:MAT+ sexual cell fertilization-promoting factor [Penicillium rolfsii]|nr:MAT+ sexual cell fertilization-promoting factor [Penicillium rolfsii]
MDAFSPTEQATELIWRHGLANLPSTGNEIMIPFNVIKTHGYDLVRDVAFILGSHLNLPVVVVMDISIRALRIRAHNNSQLLPIDVQTHKLLTQLIKGAGLDGLLIPIERAHIPRPPNSFILYRQHHHHAITAANPGVPNTDISRIIAEMWRNESPEVRNCFKELAEEKKQLHAIAYPNYQYCPRRPSEKVRRQRKIHVDNMPWLGQHPLGQKLVDDAANNRGFIPVNEEFIAAIDAIDILRGPNGVAPILPQHNPNVRQDLQSQLDRDMSLTVVQWHPLQGNEFDENFPMSEMLNLEGA